MLPRRVLLVFVDGIGLGRPGAQNPFDGAPVDILAPLADPGRAGAAGVVLGALDACLAHPGLPQSATGQATIFTGENGALVDGGHRSGFPTRALAEMILQKSVFAAARARGQRAGFLNGFDRDRAARMARIVAGIDPRPKLRPPSASSLAALAGNGTLRTFEDVERGAAATFDLTGEVCRALGVVAPIRTLRQAARAVAKGAAELDLAYFELFTTDKAGHAQDMTWARFEIAKTERFLVELFAAIDPREQLVVVTSDHGNLEDLSTRSHTLAKVPLFAYGNGADAFVDGAKSLLDVAPRLLTHCAQGPRTSG